MAFTYGFYNSVDHDRTYDAEQLSSIFDGIITDGVYATYKDALRVVVSTDGTAVVIKPGRAWFKHTWSYVDSDYPLAVLAAHAAYNRIDALVLDINGDTQYRENKIMWVQGTAASTPTKPALTNIDSQKHWQYPLAYVTRRSNSSTIADGDVEPVIGTSACPYVTGVVEGVDIDSWFTYWNGQYQQFSSNFNTWMNDQEYIWTQWFTSIEAGYEEQRIVLTDWIRQYTSSLDDDPANRLFKQVMDIYEKHNVLTGENLMFNPYVDGLEKTSNGITFKVNYEGRNDGVFDGYQGHGDGFKHQNKVPYGAIEISGVSTGQATFDILMPTWEELGRYWDGWYNDPAKLAADPDYKYKDLLSLGLNYRLTLMPWANGSASDFLSFKYDYTSDYAAFSKVHMDLLICCPEDKGYIYQDGKSATREWVKAISIPYWTSGKNYEADSLSHLPSYSIDLTPLDSPTTGKVKTVKRFSIENTKDILSDFSHSLGGLNAFWGLRITVDAGADLTRQTYTNKAMVVVPVIQYIPSYTNLQPEAGINVVNDNDMAPNFLTSYESVRASWYTMERAYSLRKLTSMIDGVTQYIEKEVSLNTSSTTTVTFTDKRISDTSYLELYCNDASISYVSVGTSGNTTSYTIQQVDSAKTVTFRLYIR